jgi:hypothetical protein
MLIAITLVLEAATGGMQADLHVVSTRRIYQRGEIAEIWVRDAAAGSRFRYEAEGLPPVEGERLRLNTGLLKAGDYVIRVGDSGGRRGTFDLSIAPPRNPQRYPVYRWGIVSSNFDFWTSRGFTGAHSVAIADPIDRSSPLYASLRRALQESEKRNFDMGLAIRPVLSKANAPAQVTSGGRSLGPYPRHPAALEHAKQVAASVGANFSEFKAWRHSPLNTEVHLPPTDFPLARQLAQKELGLDISKLQRAADLPAEHQPKNGLIEDNNPYYRYLRWWYHDGMGDAEMNAQIAATLRRDRPDVLLWHDPYRFAPVHGSHKGLDAVATWTYAQPNMGRLYMASVLQSIARRERQKTMQIVTLHFYSRFVRPVRGGTDDFLTAGPDFARLATWLSFSQRPDILSFYGAGAQAPDREDLDREIASPESWEAVADVIRTLIEPYGPMVLAGQRPKPRVAVLMSAAATWFPNEPANIGYPAEQILPYVSLLGMLGIPFDVLLDEDVTAGRLSAYDALIIPRADTLLRSVHSRVAAFAKQGKKVIADRTLRASIPGAEVTTYSFAYQRRVQGTAAEMITSEEDQRRLEVAARDLGKRLAAIPRPAYADSMQAFVNTLQIGSARAVFVVNDHRTYGPRFGQHRLHRERGLPQRVQVTVAVTGSPVIYDALTGRAVNATVRNGQATFAADLPPAEGKLYIVLPEKPGRVNIQAPAQMTPGVEAAIRVQVLGSSGKPMNLPYPLRIDVLDPQGRINEFSRSVAAPAGAYTMPFIPAANEPTGDWTIRVTDLVTRSVHSVKFRR